MNPEQQKALAELVLANDARLDDLAASVNVLQEFLLDQFDLAGPPATQLRSYCEQFEAAARDAAVARSQIKSHFGAFPDAAPPARRGSSRTTTASRFSLLLSHIEQQQEAAQRAVVVENGGV